MFILTELNYISLDGFVNAWQFIFWSLVFYSFISLFISVCKLGFIQWSYRVHFIYKWFEANDYYISRYFINSLNHVENLLQCGFSYSTGKSSSSSSPTEFWRILNNVDCSKPMTCMSFLVLVSVTIKARQKQRPSLLVQGQTSV